MQLLKFAIAAVLKLEMATSLSGTCSLLSQDADEVYTYTKDIASTLPGGPDNTSALLIPLRI